MRLVPLPNPAKERLRMFIGSQSPTLGLPLWTWRSFHSLNVSRTHVAKRSLYVNPPARRHAWRRSDEGKLNVVQRLFPERVTFGVHSGSQALSKAKRLRRTDVVARRNESSAEAEGRLSPYAMLS